MVETDRKMKDGGPAFPHEEFVPFDPETGFVRDPVRASAGMSLRDWFAGQALAGVLASRAHPDIDMMHKPVFSQLAAVCYEAADAMLAARKGGSDVD